MKQKQFNDKIKNSLKDKPPFVPEFCNICGSYSSKQHKGIWCSRCPGKMTKYPEMTWEDCLIKSHRQGSGWFNTLWLHHIGWDEKTDKLWMKMGASTQIRKWCKLL